MNNKKKVFLRLKLLDRIEKIIVHVVGGCLIVTVIILTVLRDGQFTEKYNEQIKDRATMDSIVQYSSYQSVLMFKDLCYSLDSISAKINSLQRLIEIQNEKIKTCVDDVSQQTKATIKSLNK